VRADLSEIDKLAGLARELVDTFGAPFGLVNNAAGAIDGILPNLTDRQVQEAIGLDLVSPVILTKHLVRPMISRKVGRIVNVSSIVASTGFRGLSVYASTKAGLVGFTRSLARDVGSRGVTVNAVAPGFLDTEMTGGMNAATSERVRSRSPVGRFATVDEVAGTVAFLLSADAAGITGTVLTVDAGSTA
jgi:3-oxoacyl-[acyl-carrier protein] reductase